MILLPWQPQVVLNDEPKTNISITTSLLASNKFYTILCVAMVTKLKKLS